MIQQAGQAGVCRGAGARWGPENMSATHSRSQQLGNTENERHLHCHEVPDVAAGQHPVFHRTEEAGVAEADTACPWAAWEYLYSERADDRA